MSPFSVVVSASTHNFICLIFISFIALWLIRSIFTFAEARYGLMCLEQRDKSRSANGPIADDTTIPETIIVHLDGMAPVIKTVTNLVQPHVIELIGNNQDLHPTKLPLIDLPIFLSLPPIDDNGGIMHYSAMENMISLTLNLRMQPNRTGKLFTFFGVERSFLRLVGSNQHLGLGLFFKHLTQTDENRKPPYLCASTQMITGNDLNGCKVEIKSMNKDLFQFDLRDRFPMVSIAYGGVNSRSHILVFDTLGRSGTSFTPTDMAALRLYKTQEYFTATQPIVSAWIERVTFTEDDDADGNVTLSVVPQPTTNVIAMLKREQIDTSRFEELDVTAPMIKPMELYGRDDGDPCLVCLDADRDVTLLPCRHSPMCSVCLLEMRKSQCPICRGPLDGYLQYSTPIDFEHRI